MRNSLKNLLDMFPYFFNKRETSNFYKSQRVTNNLFKDVYQVLFDTKESFRLNKRCLIWKEQSRPYDYTIHFVANFPFIKEVSILKDDVLIYSNSYEYEENMTEFNYDYTSSTLNDVEDIDDADIIPQNRFKLIVNTWEEHKIIKGFPENDTIQGNEFDHDESLDEIAALHDIPRKEYIKVDEDLYPATEPPYNDRLTEDDYHYMKRIIEYLFRVHTQPLPVAEVWKLYGIESTMENREKLLLKVFDLKKHPNFHDPDSPGDGWFSGTKNDDGTITPWQPKQWEHLDKFCDANDYLGKYFFTKISTTIPGKNESIFLYFYFMNSLAKPLGGEHLVDIVLNDSTIIVENYSGDSFEITPDKIPSEGINTFTITGKTSDGEIIGIEEIDISVRGCSDADFYVSTTGSDNNDGKTAQTAFRTIQKAVNKVNGNQNLIAILPGEYLIESPVTINKNCTLLGCNGVSIENAHENIFFRINKGILVSFQDFIIYYQENSSDIQNMLVTNNNTDNSPVDVLLSEDSSVVLIPIQEVLEDYDAIITDMFYVNNVWKYTSKNVSEITKLSDLDGAIKNIKYQNGVITFDKFHSQSSHSELDPYERESLNGILVELKYRNGIVKYEEVSTE